MLFSKAITQRIVEEVRERPLEDDETRRVAGMEELYFANADTVIERNFLYLFTLEIADASYLFFRKLESVPE